MRSQLLSALSTRLSDPCRRHSQFSTPHVDGLQTCRNTSGAHVDIRAVRACHASHSETSRVRCPLSMVNALSSGRSALNAEPQRTGNAALTPEISTNTIQIQCSTSSLSHQSSCIWPIHSRSRASAHLWCRTAVPLLLAETRQNRCGPFEAALWLHQRVSMTTCPGVHWHPPAPCAPGQLPGSHVDCPAGPGPARPSLRTHRTRPALCDMWCAPSLVVLYDHRPVCR
jgi:hypothetical protein